jgi:flagellar basal body-associated protein FliL
MRKTKPRELQDWARWTKRIALVILISMVIFLAYVIGAAIWKKFSGIKKNYKSIEQGQANVILSEFAKANEALALS